VCVDPFNIAAIQCSVPVCYFEGRAGTVDASHLRAFRRKVQCETSLVAEDIECLAVCVLCRRGIVLALVEKSTSLLAFNGVVMELDGVHGDRSGRLVSSEKAGGAW